MMTPKTETHWRKKANVSLETFPVFGIPESDVVLPLTKCGVAASFPLVRSSNASPVWNATPPSHQSISLNSETIAWGSRGERGRREGGKERRRTYRDNLEVWSLLQLRVVVYRVYAGDISIILLIEMVEGRVLVGKLNRVGRGTLRNLFLSSIR